MEDSHDCVCCNSRFPPTYVDATLPSVPDDQQLVQQLREEYQEYLDVSGKLNNKDIPYPLLINRLMFVDDCDIVNLLANNATDDQILDEYRRTADKICKTGLLTQIIKEKKSDYYH